MDTANNVSFLPFDNFVMRRSFVCMVVYRLLLTLLTRSVPLIVSKKSLMKVLCAIYYGLILMIEVAGASLLVGQATPLDRTLQKHSITTMDSPWSQEHISWLWRYFVEHSGVHPLTHRLHCRIIIRATIGPMIGTL